MFGHRLKEELVKRGNDFTPHNPSNSICIIQGNYYPSCKNILRLDGLYFDSNNPNNEQLNSPIFKCYKEFDHIVFQSMFAKNMYESFTGVKKDHTIIYNGINPDFREYSPHNANERDHYFFLTGLKKKFRKLFIASASWRRHKRLEETIQAFKNNKLKDCALIALGGEEYILKNYGPECVPENVFLFPILPFYSTSVFYSLADAMIHLCMFDTCPNSVIESLICGTPVLCSHNGGTHEIVRGNGVVVKLEEDYSPGTYYPYYDPPKIDIEAIATGALEAAKCPKNFRREDLEIENVAKKYEDIMI